jgi:hypothetical protein
MAWFGPLAAGGADLLSAPAQAFSITAEAGSYLVSGTAATLTAGAVTDMLVHVATPTPDSTDAATYTFNSVSFGHALARKIVVTVNWGSNTTVSIESVTIGGVAADIVVTQAPNNTSAAAIAVADMDAGTTSGSLVITFTASVNRCAPVVYEMFDAASNTPHDTLTATATDPLTGDLDIPANGCAVACGAGSYAGSTSATWTNLNEDVDADAEASRRYSSAHINVTTEQLAETITLDWAVGITANTTALAAASWAVAEATQSGGGWLSPEQARAQLREIRRQEKQEQERKAKIKAKARELEETIADAYAKATGKPRLKKALEGVEAPSEFTPETIAQIGQDLVTALSGALEGSGRRYSGDRRRVEELQRQLVEFEFLLNEREAQQRFDDEIAAILLLAAV